jgi:hypothetical protein
VSSRAATWVIAPPKGGSKEIVPLVVQGQGTDRCNGLALIKLLVVVAIIGLLRGLLLPALSQAENLARRTACLSNLRQIGPGAASHSNDHAGCMPFVPDSELRLTPPGNGTGKRYCRMGSFIPLIYPYIGVSHKNRGVRKGVAHKPQGSARRTPGRHEGVCGQSNVDAKTHLLAKKVICPHNEPRQI